MEGLLMSYYLPVTECWFFRIIWRAL